MNPTIYFSICSIFYCFLLIFKLRSIPDSSNVSKKTLQVLALINLGNLLCEAIGMFLGSNYENFKLLNDISLRLMLVLYISWFTFYVIFVKNISLKNKSLDFKDNSIIYIIMLICLCLSVFLPMTYVTNDEGVIIYSTGLAVQVIYYYIIASNVACLFMMFKNMKKVKLHNYSSLFVLVILSTLSAAIQSQYPSILLTATSSTFVLHMAYYNFIENHFFVKKEND